MLFHIFKGGALGGFGINIDPPGILRRQEPHRHHLEQPDRQQGDQQGHHHGTAAVLQHQLQCPFIPVQQTVKEAFHHQVQTTMVPAMGFQETAAEHRGQT